MNEAAVTSKDQITMPVGIRKSIRLKARDRVVCTRLANGTAVVRAKVRSIADSAGTVPKPRKALGPDP